VGSSRISTAKYYVRQLEKGEGGEGGDRDERSVYEGRQEEGRMDGRMEGGKEERKKGR
jgi:hypothetical protein